MTPDGLDELLAGMYEILKRHEQVLLDLTMDVEGLKSTLTGPDADTLQRAKEKALRVSSKEHALQLRLYDAMISRLRGT